MRVRRPVRSKASVLVALLWCLALLSLVVIGVLHSSRLALTSVRHHSDAVQARYLALAGIEKAKALLYRDRRDRQRSAQSYGASLADAPAEFREIELGRGKFSVLRAAREDEGGGVVYGVGDEDGRLNVNIASAEELSRLQGMTPDLVAALVDWRDGDQTASPGGAESDYYLSGPNPTLVRDGPLETLRELLMVRGVSQEALFGEDPRGIGLLDEDDPSAEGGGEVQVRAALDRGWAESLTVHSATVNMSASGQQRVSLRTADEAALTQVRGMTADIAKGIIARRGRGGINSLADLLDVQAAPPEGAPQGAPGGPGGGGPGLPVEFSGPGQPGRGGPNLIDAQLLREIADEVTASDEEELVGLVNVNSASLDVLASLPGMTRELAQSVISYRSSSGFLPNIAHLLLVPGLTEDVFKALAPRVTVRSDTYRILGEGRMPGTGSMKRVEVVVRVTGNDVMTLAYREDDL